MRKTIAVNAGSSTLKFKLFAMPSEAVIATGLIDRIGLGNSEIKISYGDDQTFSQKQDVANHEIAVQILLKELLRLDIIQDYHEITGVGHRVVAGGEAFHDSTLIDDDVVKKIDQLAEYAPLHNPANATGIRAFRKILPDVPAVAVFDTSFHTTLPEENYIYSIPYQYYQKFGVRKYGAHGTSHRYVAMRAAAMLDKPLTELKLITCHLGSGASITAIDHGKSLDTSMGFTPVAGITMSSRSGDVDPSLVAWLMQKLELKDPQEMIDILNEKSGLLGISGVSADMREIIEASQTSHRAKLAIKIFVNRIIKYIGSYVAEMHGVDAIVITAGIGERSSEIRQLIANELAYFGVSIDPVKNQAQSVEKDLSTDDATVRFLLIPTNEELMIAREVERVGHLAE